MQHTEKVVYTAYHLLGPVPSDLMERRDGASRRRRGGPAREAVPPGLGALASLVDEVRPHAGAAHPRSRVTQASRRPSPALPRWPCLGRVGALGSKGEGLDNQVASPHGRRAPGAPAPPAPQALTPLARAPFQAGEAEDGEGGGDAEQGGDANGDVEHRRAQAELDDSRGRRNSSFVTCHIPGCGAVLSSSDPSVKRSNMRYRCGRGAIWGTTTNLLGAAS